MAGKNGKLTSLESVIMDAVWRLSEATVRQVQARLKSTKPMAYNTVLTMMRILREKGFLASERQGRVDVYRPLVSKENMARRNLRDLMQRFFAGSARALVSQLLETESLDEAEIQAIREEINTTLRRKTRAKTKGETLCKSSSKQ
ncbi:MAG: BlaI/MecI/CopY family transcriptional regulator [Phycisphaerae bacterium]|nr:BlaI/MecI/CopY family transcriptional regulator [Phycisphaerae bacterium]